MANDLVKRGHEVTLLIGEGATYRGQHRATHVEVFGTTADLESSLRLTANRAVRAVFHAAAVSDFKFGRIWTGPDQDQLLGKAPGKVSTRHGTLVVELLPTSKIISKLRDWFPSTSLVGWKFEVEGDASRALESARTQIAECRTDACVANGPAYGAGFGLVTSASEPRHLADQQSLFEALAGLVENH